MRTLPPLPSRTLDAAKQLHATETDAEQALWFHLRARRLCGHKFRRQHPLPPYIVDFYCDELKLVVELDGSQHTTRSDARRTASLERRGLEMLRFWDNQVLTDMDSVLQVILDFARSRTLSPTPLPGSSLAKQPPALASARAFTPARVATGNSQALALTPRGEGL